MAEHITRRMIEKRTRGFFGWIFLLIFWGFNALMAAWLIVGMSGNAEKYQTLTSEAARTGHAAGTGIAFMMILMVWALGAVIFGMLAYFTRGRREMIEIETRGT